jgi:gamma-glutamylcyclotransferase (GGCT)/AIG2-like uncharacterized protein YtfP
MDSLIKIFVYGTLKPNYANYNLYCRGQTISEIPAYTYGSLYLLPGLGYPALSEGTGVVWGYLFFFDNANILKDLDILEDYQSDRNESENEYQRKLIEVYKQENEKTEKAWAYLMKLEKIKSYGGIPIESGNFN